MLLFYSNYLLNHTNNFHSFFLSEECLLLSLLAGFCFMINNIHIFIFKYDNNYNNMHVETILNKLIHLNLH